MPGISHEDMLSLGKTVMPMRMEHMKELVGLEVEEDYGSYRMKGTPNSADITFVRIDDRGYIYLNFNPNWIHQFHPDEWDDIEQRLDESPFVKGFGSKTRRKYLLSEKTWHRQFQSRYEKTVDGR